MSLIVDIETDGLLDTMTKIHVIALYDTQTQEYEVYDKEETKQAIKRLEEANELIFHNGIAFDILAIKKIYPDFKPKRVLDTLVMSRVVWSNIKESDFSLVKKGTLDSKLIGSHSLKAYGQRLKVFKGNYGEIHDWKEWTQEMSDYCKQDVKVTLALWEKLQSKEIIQKTIELEHTVQEIITRQINYGFLFDYDKAEQLYAELIGKKEKLHRKLQKVFKPWFKKIKEVKSKRDVTYKAGKLYKYKTTITKNSPYTQIKLEVFNPGSRDHIIYQLKKRYGWKPTEFTDKGKPKINEEVLSSLKYKEVSLLIEYLIIAKLLGQLSDGDKAWLQHVKKDSRIHGYVNINGAVTGRATHSYPNIGQVPSPRSTYGKECRQLFTVPKNKILIGCDLSGIELRCLAHFMAKYDDGAYIKEVLEGDIHTVNQKAAELPTRDMAKTFFYALIYGGGNQKIGSIIGKGAREGSQIKTKFFKKLPAMKSLLNDIHKNIKNRGYLIGLDGRHLHIRSIHSSLNVLLQSAGALISKRWLIEYQKILHQKGLIPIKDYEQVAWVHDEVEVECLPKHKEIICKALEDGALKAGEFFNFKIPVEAESKVGRTWYDVH